MFASSYRDDIFVGSAVEQILAFLCSIRGNLSAVVFSFIHVDLTSSFEIFIDALRYTDDLLSQMHPLFK